jgi:beta-galactosidase
VQINLSRELKSTITYDRKSFIISGERVFLHSAAIHYFRMPRKEWREVLVKAKLAGINCIDTYFAWNVHEPNKGDWHFEGDADCGEFLDLCAELGLWVLARPGPYICAEWDFGGFPWWLGQEEGIKFRDFNKVYLKHVDLYFDHIIEIIRQRQLTEGGSVILVQVENEYEYLADDESGRLYLSHLKNGIERRGINVPLITCVGGLEGTIEGANFWRGADEHYDALVNKQPDTPKLVTEFWSGWFEHWGAASATHKTPQIYEKRLYEVVQAGFDGISHYMFYGGTNFGSYGGRTVGSSDIYMVTSYDYDAPLDEYGRTTGKYMAAKRFTYWVYANKELLLQSESFDPIHIQTSPGINVRGRQSAEQKILFVESTLEERETFYITLEDGRTMPVTVNPGEIVPVLEQAEMMNGVKLSCNTFIACNEEVDGIHTLIVHARRGQRSWVKISGEQNIILTAEKSQLYELSADNRMVVFDFYHFDEPQVVELLLGEQPLRLIIVHTEEMNKIWRIAEGRWISGFNDVNMNAEGTLWGNMSHLAGCSNLFGGNDLGPVFDSIREQTAANMLLQPPSLTAWESKSLDLSRVKGDAVTQPKDFSSFMQPYGYLVYSTELESQTDRMTVLVMPNLQDPARIYVNGLEVGLIREVGSSSIGIPLRKGTNQLQLLVQNMGRLNFSPYLGEPKGLFDTAYLDGSAIDMRGGWTCEEQTIHLGQVTNLDGHPTMRRSFQLQAHDHATLVGAISTPLFINGKEVSLDGYHNWFAYMSVDVSEYVIQGDNVIEMPFFKAPIDRLQLLTYDISAGIKGWHMAGFVDETFDDQYVIPLQDGMPAWHRCEFDKPNVAEAVNIRLKLRLTGMSKGIIWLNGRDIGRYWQIGPQEDYKIPLSWLKERNEIILFDEAGCSPDRVQLLYDEQSLNTWAKLDS